MQQITTYVTSVTKTAPLQTCTMHIKKRCWEH